VSTAFPRLVMSASLAVAFATAPAGTTAQEEAASSPLPIEGSVSVFGFGYETGDEVATVRVDHFREVYPDIDVRFSESGWDEQQFLTALSSSAPPDVVNIPRNVIGTYIARGVLQPVDECMAQQGVDPSAYRPAALAQVSVDGAVYGFPQFFNTRLWLINEAAFEEAGLDAADFDWSDWQAIAAANEQLTQVDGGLLTKIGIDPKLPEFLPLWAKANGVELLSPDGRTSQLDDPRIAEALAFAASLHEPAGGQAPFLDFRDTWDFFGAGNQFASNQLGAFPMEQWYLNVLADVSPDVPLAVAPFVDREGAPLTWADGDAFAIVTDTPNAEAACAFAATMTGADAWIAAARSRAESRAEEGKPNTGVYTANREADEVIFGEIVDLSDMPRFEAAVQTVLDTQEQAFAIPPSPANAEFAQAWRSAVEAVTSGGSDPGQALAQADSAAQAAIDAAAAR
jgi:multiple sugar transport system substrate-binding protein